MYAGAEDLGECVDKTLVLKISSALLKSGGVPAMSGDVVV